MLNIPHLISHHQPPTPSQVIWLWTSKWTKPSQRKFIAIELSSLAIDRVMVAVGLAGSRAEAQRLIKAGSVEWRPDDDRLRARWERVKEFGQLLPQGTPWIIRVGNGLWRVDRVIGRVTGHQIVMAPLPTQDIKWWSREWREEREAWWTRVMDKLRDRLGMVP